MQQAEQCLIRGDYGKAAKLYEQAIELEPEVKSHYWHLGLVLLLQGQEAEAQMTWLIGMAEGEPEQVELWTVELMQVLQAEAQRREKLADYSVAWVIRQHGQEISPTDINNLLYLIQLSIKLEKFSGEELTSLGVIELLQSEQPIGVDLGLLLHVLQSVLDAAPLHPSTLELSTACVAHIQPQTFIDILVPASVEIAYSAKQPGLAARFAELCLRLDAGNTQVLRHLSAFYQDAGDYSKGIEIAKLCYSTAETLLEKVFANNLIIRGLMSAGGYWKEAYAAFQHHKTLLLSLIEQPKLLNRDTVLYEWH